MSFSSGIDMDVFAFYLPQFHGDAMNDAHWGEGFTDWITTARATPLYSRHRQPFLPSELGCYDLTDVNVLRRQADLARSNGVEGFAFYYYHFDVGTKALTRPLELLLENKDINISYFVSWVNADWTKSWVGDDRTVLYSQRYNEDFFRAFAHDLCCYAKDERYFKISERPVLYIHDPSALDVILFKAIMRDVLAKHGLPDFIYIAPEIHLNSRERIHFDFVLGYPPGDWNLFRTKNILLRLFFKICNSKIPGYLKRIFFKQLGVFSYADYCKGYLKFMLEGKLSDEKYIPTLLSGWDNTPRYKFKGFAIDDFSPEKFGALAENVMLEAAKEGKKFIMVKAWNEWAEGNVLEPSAHFGRSTLSSFKDAKKKALLSLKNGITD
jgi:hypothetical protein